MPDTQDVSKRFMNLPQSEKENVVNHITDVCGQYCAREDCNGCFIQTLTDITVKGME